MSTDLIATRLHEARGTRHVATETAVDHVVLGDDTTAAPRTSVAREAEVAVFAPAAVRACADAPVFGVTTARQPSVLAKMRMTAPRALRPATADAAAPRASPLSPASGAGESVAALATGESEARAVFRSVDATAWRAYLLACGPPAVSALHSPPLHTMFAPTRPTCAGATTAVPAAGVRTARSRRRRRRRGRRRRAGGQHG